jgi:hypothetical protein
MMIEFTSPRTTALNHTVQSLPIVTLPTIVAFGANQQFSPFCGIFPKTGNIRAMFILCLFIRKVFLYVGLDKKKFQISN